MKRHSITGWLGACVLGSALVAGCHHVNHCPHSCQYTSCHASTGALSSTCPYAVPSTVCQNSVPGGTYTVTPIGDAPVIVASQELRLPPVVESATGQIVEVLPNSAAPVVVAEARVGTVPGVNPVEKPAEKATQKVVERTVEAPKPIELASGTVKSARPSFGVTTQTFGHANDYTWLCGQVSYSRFSKTWRLRYASVDEVDPYGGSVTLVDEGQLANLRDGQYVRVQGNLLEPDQRASAPSYRVNALQPAEVKN